ncbi:hypothetical protein EU527_12065 [Candidatus Thorarchaeota archaeon]|nr:MAG: hypothetical protein EU527_12065 [Candidatus Thorarchaeota archaeon]
MPINIVPFFSLVSPEGLSNEVLKEIEHEGVKILDNKDKVPCDRPLFILIGTGGTENSVKTFIEDNRVTAPITLLSYDERNSLPAAMEIRAYLQKKGTSARIVHRKLGDLQALLGQWSQYIKIKENLRESTIGVIGEPSSWLIASDIDPNEVRKRWGTEIKKIPIEDLTKKLPKEMNETISNQVHDFQSMADCQSVENDEIKKAGTVAQRISEISEIHNLAAVTVQCFSLLQDTDISGCFALSYLNDKEDFVAGCEGDIPATFTLLIAKMLTGVPALMANVATVNQDLNTAVFAHCTVPRGITENYEITSHFETGMSVGIRGRLPLTDVTIVKVFGDDLSKYWVSGGTIIGNLVNDKGCRTQIRVALEEPVDYFLEESLANHHIVILGDFVQEFIEFFEFMNLY